MQFFTRCANPRIHVGSSTFLISLVCIYVVGIYLQNVDAGFNPYPQKKANPKRFCSVATKTHLLTQNEDEYGGYDKQEGVETELDKAQPGCSPPEEVTWKVLNDTAFQLNWHQKAAQVIPIKYFIVEWEQAKEEGKPVTKCRSWVEYVTDNKNHTTTHHETVVGDLISDHKFQFRIVTVYNDYQFYPSPYTPWIDLPGDGMAPRVTKFPGETRPSM